MQLNYGIITLVLCICLGTVDVTGEGSFLSISADDFSEIYKHVAEAANTIRKRNPESNLVPVPELKLTERSLEKRSLLPLPMVTGFVGGLMGLLITVISRIPIAGPVAYPILIGVATLLHTIFVPLFGE